MIVFGTPSIKTNINFKVNPGDRVGIMGSTGAGKSTLINLITRFYDPGNGTVLADNIDIKDRIITIRQ